MKLYIKLNFNLLGDFGEKNMIVLMSLFKPFTYKQPQEEAKYQISLYSVH